MKPIKILDTIINRLSTLTNSCSGKLYGIASKEELIVTFLEDDQKDVNVSDSLPAGVNFCGFFNVSNDKSVNVPVTPKTVLLQYNIEEKTFKLYSENNVDAPYTTITEKDINNSYLYIRIKGQIPLKSEFTTEAIKDTFQILQKKLQEELVFNVLKTNIFLLDNETLGIENNVSLNEITDESNNYQEEGNRKKKSIASKPRVMDFRTLKQLTSKSGENGKGHAPIGILDKHPLRVIDTILEINSLAIVKDNTYIQNVYPVLLESINRLLNLYEYNITSFLNNSKSASNLVYQIFHYYPEGCKQFLTLLYNQNESDNDLKAKRLHLHKKLLLDTSFPCFRRSNKYIFDKKLNGPLINPHEGVKLTDNGGTIALVKGKYEYYHYCQDKMDDNGWGCAYRSLQTLASWFKLQGYVEREVPTFTEIQQCLVDIKDKPSSFVGSRQWIGSTEVNYVLNTLLGVENKILYVSSGDDMASKGPELISHFQNHGSPVMIGGGVLAHTILGVDYNQKTGEIKFLILDPHYTGSEDLQTIQNKGWCGWKNANFWDKGSYYNMCLPLVPRGV